MEANKTPIAQAVEPLRASAMQRAAEYADKVANEIVSNIEAHGWDVEKAYPYPKSGVGRAQYAVAKVRYDMARYLTKTDTTKHTRSRHFGEPHFVVHNPERVAMFIEQARDNASRTYDAFIAKLVNKVGDHQRAELVGNHVWGYSTLTVLTPNGEQRWKTQQIVNVSKLGKVFNQWPTRLLK